MADKPDKRTFNGPFFVYGILRHFPKELEQREEGGPFSDLSSFVPLYVEPLPVPKMDFLIAQHPQLAKKEEATIADKTLTRKIRELKNSQLEALAMALLEPRTAREVASRLKISLPTVYKRIRALRAQLTVRESMSRGGSRGPESKTFQISKKP